MRPGGGKGKGSAFERKVCVDLSLMISGGKQSDIFWRSAMSGGRATSRIRRAKNRYRRSVDNVRQGGDICAVAPEGNAFSEHWFVECKFVRRLNLDGFLMLNIGPLAQFWKIAKEQAARHNREPMVIAKQNNGPIIVVTNIGALEHYTASQLTSHARSCDVSLYHDMLLGGRP
jgi:hypothetical protein